MWWTLLVLGAHAGNPCNTLTRRPLTDRITYRAAWMCLGLGCFDQFAIGRLKDGTPVVVTTLSLQPGSLGTGEPQWIPIDSVDLITQGGKRLDLGPSKVVRVTRMVDAESAMSRLQLHIQSTISPEALAVLSEDRITEAEVVLGGTGFGNSRLLFVPSGSRRRLMRAAQCLAQPPPQD